MSTIVLQAQERYEKCRPLSCRRRNAMKNVDRCRNEFLPKEILSRNIELVRLRLDDVFGGIVERYGYPSA